MDTHLLVSGKVRVPPSLLRRSDGSRFVVLINHRERPLEESTPIHDPSDMVGFEWHTRVRSSCDSLGRTNLRFVGNDVVNSGDILRVELPPGGGGVLDDLFRLRDSGDDGSNERLRHEPGDRELEEGVATL
jgi:hypothetical protein